MVCQYPKNIFLQGGDLTKDKNNFFDKATICITIICVIIITSIGCTFLMMEHVDKSTIVTFSDNQVTKDAIDSYFASDKTKEGKYASEVFGLININSAPKEDLMLLPGIGDTKAEAIIAYRSKTPFAKIEDILNVKGIGEKTFQKLKNIICVN